MDVEQLLDQKLEQIPGMTLGQLDNGLRYVILPNKVPPNRFEAHLEMHVGEHRGDVTLCTRLRLASGALEQWENMYIAQRASCSTLCAQC